jgi:NAD(P)-dependent dehydrogenase (short-subunit alcohol dehydrogenase family)
MTTNDEQSGANVFDLFRLQGKTALVTGAAGHLGHALASALAEAGARVVTTSRDADRAAATATSLPNYKEAGHFGVRLDHTDPQSICTSIEEINQQAGQIDILVNNAHEAIDRDWQTISGEQFQAQLANLTGYFLLARHVRNLAVERRHVASIVLLGSMYGVVGSYPDAYENLVTASPAAYHALKGGIVHLTRHLAVYWAKDNVRVNCLSPGPFPSAKANSQMVKRLIAKSPMRRMGAPHELKGAILLLASNAGSYITGQNLVVDGGWTAW